MIEIILLGMVPVLFAVAIGLFIKVLNGLEAHYQEEHKKIQERGRQQREQHKARMSSYPK